MEYTQLETSGRSLHVRRVPSYSRALAPRHGPTDQKTQHASEVPIYLAPHIYETTHSSSELRQWFIEATAYAIGYIGSGTYSYPPIFYTSYPLELRDDLTAALNWFQSRGYGRGLIPIFDKCEYHVRDQDGHCRRSEVIEEWHRWASKGRHSLIQPDSGHF